MRCEFDDDAIPVEFELPMNMYAPASLSTKIMRVAGDSVFVETDEPIVMTCV